MLDIGSGAARRLAGLTLAFLMLVVGCGGENQPAGATSAILKTDVTTLSLTGTWWDPSAPGTGFFFESQGSVGVVTFYVYDDHGKPVWYSANGNLTGGPFQYSFSGQLQRFVGGQHAGSSVPRTPVATGVGPVTITFESGKALVKLPAREFIAEKFQRQALPFGPPPETGIYWNPAESGRGYSMEVANGVASIGVFHYDKNGEPTWHLVVAPLDADSGAATGAFTSYRGGQTLNGPFKALTSVVDEGRFRATFDSSCGGSVAFPGMDPVPVRRFAFGSLPPGSECRGGSSPRSTFPGVELVLQAPARIEGQTFQGGVLPGDLEFAVKGDMESLKSKTLYGYVESTDQLFSGFDEVRYNDEKKTVGLSLRGVPLARTGSYEGTLRVHACTDAMCKSYLAGTPVAVPYKFTVGPGPSLTPSSIHAVLPDGTPSVRVPAKLVVPPGTQPDISINAFSRGLSWDVPGFEKRYGGIIVPTSDKTQEITIFFTFEKDGYADYTGWVAGKAQTTGGTMGAGDFFFPMTFAVKRGGTANTNLTALSPLPGAGSWTGYQGNSAHSGYVPADLAAPAFTRRFVRNGPASAVATANGSVFFVSGQRNGEWTLHRVDEQSGELVWSTPLGVTYHVNAPALADGKLLVTSTGWEASSFWTIDAGTGAVLTKAPLSSQFEDQWQPPTVHGSSAYTSNGYYGGTSRLDLHSGKVVWTVPHSYGPGIALTPIGSSLFLLGKGELLEWNAADGKTLSATPDPASTAGAGISGTVVSDANGALYATQWGDGSLTKFNIADKKVAWSVRGPFFSDPVITPQAIYLRTVTGLHARSPADGSLLWAWESGSERYYPSQVIVVGRYAFFQGAGGTYALDTSTRQIAWQDTAVGVLGVSDNGVLYISSRQSLVAVNLR